MPWKRLLGAVLPLLVACALVGCGNSKKTEEGRAQLVQRVADQLQAAKAKADGYDFDGAKAILRDLPEQVDKSPFADVETYDKLTADIEAIRGRVFQQEADHRKRIRAGWKLIDGRFVSPAEQQRALAEEKRRQKEEAKRKEEERRIAQARARAQAEAQACAKAEAEAQARAKAEAEAQARAKARAEAWARVKARLEAWARAKAQREARRKAAQREVKDRLDAYVALLEAAEVKLIERVSVRRIGDDMWEATLTVDNLWHVRHYQIRLQDAQTLWEGWAIIASPKDPDKARIKLVDIRGNEVGGSRVWAGSLIWVKED